MCKILIVRSCPSLEIFRLCIQSVCPTSNVSSLKESQFQALYSIICSEEVFVNFPTRSSQSLIFQMVPLVHTWMHENVSAIHCKENPVISPLLGLMQDQVKKLPIGFFKAAFVSPQQDLKFLCICLPFSSLHLKWKGGEIPLKATFIRRFDRHGGG